MNHWGTRLHAAVYRLSRGLLLGRMGGQPVLLLETAGRRSGLLRSTPLQYMEAGGAFVVVASNRGASHPPAWYLNLLDHPRARVQTGASSHEVEAREAGSHERPELWARLTAGNRYLDAAARKAGRTLPVVVLVKTGEPAPIP